MSLRQPLMSEKTYYFVAYIFTDVLQSQRYLNFGERNHPRTRQ